MIAPLVTACLVSVVPTTYDATTASADLHAPYGTPAMTEAGPRGRLALVLALRAAGGLDEGAPDFGWFAARHTFESEVACARSVVTAVLKSPPASADVFPSREEFRWLAGEYRATAVLYRAQAASHRDRIPWEFDREQQLAEIARRFDSAAQELECAAWRYDAWDGTSWAKPRRVTVGEMVEAGQLPR